MMVAELLKAVEVGYGTSWAQPSLDEKSIPAAANEECTMKKTDAQLQIQRAMRQVKNTSGGGHLGGTNFGQGHDAKTSSASGQSGNTRRPARKD
jgi:hypothetical protein